MTEADRRGTLAALAASLHLTAAQRRDVANVGPFRAFISGSRDVLMNLAVPVADTDDWASAIAALTAHFSAADRVPRLEFFAELHPGLAEALEASGYARDMTAPVMTLDVLGRDWPAPPPGLDLRFIRSDVPEEIAAYVDMQAEAYGEAGADWAPMLAAGILDGDMRVLAAWQDGRPIAGATLMLSMAAAELAGVGTVPSARRRGLALTVCEALLADHARLGGRLVWLSAGPGTGALYDRLGFCRVGTQLNYCFSRR